MFTDIYGAITLYDDEADALREFVDVWSDTYLQADIGPKLTCREADALAGVLNAVSPGSGDWLLQAHASGDDEGDMHYDLRSTGENN